MTKTDYNLAITSFYDSINYFENSMVNIINSKLVEGFREGYIQVCYELNEDNKERELNGLKEALKELKLKNGK